mgnify:CR=1 FL=1
MPGGRGGILGNHDDRTHETVKRFVRGRVIVLVAHRVTVVRADNAARARNHLKRNVVRGPAGNGNERRSKSQEEEEGGGGKRKKKKKGEKRKKKKGR